MIALIDRVIPDRFKQLTHGWLINHPLLWAGKFYYIVFFGIIILAANLVISFAIPVSFTFVPSNTWFLIYSLVIIVILSIVWVYSQSLITYKYLYGRTSKYHDLAVIVLFFLVVFLISLILFVPHWNLNRRIRATLTEEKLPQLKGFQPLLPGYSLPPPIKAADTLTISYPDPDSSYIKTSFIPKKLATIKNLDIARAGLASPYDLLDESEVRSLPLDKQNRADAHVIAVLSKYENYDYTKDTVALYFNRFKESPIHSKIFGATIIERKTYLFNYSSKLGDSILTYRYHDANLSKEEFYGREEIQNRLVSGKIYNDLIAAGYSDSFIQKNMYSYLANIHSAMTNNLMTADMLLLVFCFSLLVSYFAIIVCTIIKFFGIRSFLISICSLLLALVCFGFIVALIPTEGSFVGAFLYFTAVNLPMIVALAMAIVSKNKKTRVVFAQWVILLLIPCALMTVLIFDETLLDNIELNVFAYGVGFSALYVAIMLLFMKFSYFLYTLPGK